jgi:glutamate dehydrogenase (NADP+)
MLATKGDRFSGKTVVVSGSGNVAQYAVEKATQLGAKVVTMSDSAGYIYDADGIDADKLAFIMEIKNERRARISDYITKYPQAKYIAGKRPWEVKCDVALPCATQNELNEEEAKMLVANGCICVGEGANMPTTPEAVIVFQKGKILFSPGKASNAGGVTTSGLEMSQNSLRLSWTAEEVDARLQAIMLAIHASCVKYGTDATGYVDYVKGANIAGFVKVADAMLAQGVV